MRPAKRIFDVLIGFSGIVVLSPLLLATSLLILLSEGRPVLFIQERVGYQGRRFHMWKFRTMVANAESLGGTLTVGDDNRVTSVGRWLRKYKLDELPQLFNVIRGEMSLVGPRPEVPRYVSRYSQEQQAVLDLYPGITDPASITYREENRLLAESDDPERTYIESIMPDKISINMSYAAHANLWSDFLILIKTVVEVFTKGGRRVLQSNSKKLLRDVFAWDVINWSTALRFWQDHLQVELAGASALEIGAHDGGLSLWLAMQGANVICSDMRETRKQAREKHVLYGVTEKIKYQKIDARDIPYENRFNVIVFKSLLGGIRGYFGDDAHVQVVSSIFRSLKPGGQLLFAENLEASGLHRLMRNKFVNWGKTWKYLELDDIPLLFSSFAKLDFMSCGFVGTFGRTERQRRILGSFDRRVFNNVVPKHWHYIAIGVATKAI